MLVLNWQELELSYEIGSVLPSALLSVFPSFDLSRHFLGNVLLVFSKFRLEIHMKMCMTEPDFLEKIFCHQIWENGPKIVEQKAGFF